MLIQLFRFGVHISAPYEDDLSGVNGLCPNEDDLSGINETRQVNNWELDDKAPVVPIVSLVKKQ